MLEAITSRKNEGIREAAKLLTSAAERREQGRFLVEGARLCRDAAQSGVPIETAYVTESALKKYADYVNEILKKAQQAYQIEPHVAELLSDTRSPQGVFCVCCLPERMPAFSPREEKNHYLALENMQDPANLGTVLRTAEALGVHGVILGGACCDLYSPKALRASMGALFRIPVFFCESLPDSIAAWNANGVHTLAAVPASDALPVTAVDFSRKTILVVGNEGNGLTPETMEACSRRVTIPMLGRAESLNAAASASILMWEMTRSRP